MSEILTDPIKFKNLGWPSVLFYDKQEEILQSLQRNSETIVHAGNGLGKDFITGFAAFWWFNSRSPARVVTTSVKSDQLDHVLWGEIRRFINTCEVELPIHENYLHLRQVDRHGKFIDLTEMVGQVVNKGESLLGRHLPRWPIPRTFVAFDEASGIATSVYNSSRTWRHVSLVIGNPFPCENFFREAVREGDQLSKDGDYYYRKVIHIRAEDSPNIKIAFRQIMLGKRKPEAMLVRSESRPWGIYDEETYKQLLYAWEHRSEEDRLALQARALAREELIPGLIRLDTYLQNRLTFDPIMQSISLDGLFYEGAEAKMYPPDWLDRAERIADSLKTVSRRPLAMGVDSAMGGDRTCWTVVDRLGIIYQLALKTPDTSAIPDRTIALIKQYNLDPEKVLFDAGGGGHQHVDTLRRRGYNVNQVYFGEAPTDPNTYKRMRTSQDKRDARELKQVYCNRRAELYGTLRALLDPRPRYNEGGELEPTSAGFGIPRELTELRRQLSPIPLVYDEEGRLWLIPKSPKPKLGQVNHDITGQPKGMYTSMVELLGRSPDEADSTALAVFAMDYKPKTRVLVPG